jgi:hypothetical protein
LVRSGSIITAAPAPPSSASAPNTSPYARTRTPASASFAAVNAWRQGKGLTLTAASVNAALRHDAAPFERPSVILMGNEQAGLPAEAEAACDHLALIPMRGGADSLNLAQATGITLSLGDQLLLLGVAMLSSKGAAGVTGAGFITLAATLSIVPSVPIAGMALILGIDRFMSECRALTNFIGNAVATIVVSRWEKAINEDQFTAVFTHHKFGPDTALPGPEADPD